MPKEESEEEMEGSKEENRPEDARKEEGGEAGAVVDGSGEDDVEEDADEEGTEFTGSSPFGEVRASDERCRKGKEGEEDDGRSEGGNGSLEVFSFS